MKTYYYLRLCDPRTYLPLEEYVGKRGVVQICYHLGKDQSGSTPGVIKI